MEDLKNKLKSFFTTYWKYLAVSTACKLNLFDHLKEPQTVDKLAKDLALHENTLKILLEALHNEGFLNKKIANPNLYSVNELSGLLTEDHPDTLKYACILWSEEHLTAWQHLDSSIKTGKSAFEQIYGKSFFDYLNNHPKKLEDYHKAMYEYARDDYKTFPEKINFSKYNTVMDVGGGSGTLLNTIKTQFPNIQCILFDLEEVIKNVTFDEIEKISGSFFEPIPAKADAIILSRVLHDWDDNKATIILKNCYNALNEYGTLFIIENCADKIDIDLSLLSLNMTLMCESFERNSKEYNILAENAGFVKINDVMLNTLQTILIYQK